jgi:hypothetical protein
VFTAVVSDSEVPNWSLSNSSVGTLSSQSGSSTTFTAASTASGTVTLTATLPSSGVSQSANITLGTATSNGIEFTYTGAPAISAGGGTPSVALVNKTSGMVTQQSLVNSPTVVPGTVGQAYDIFIHPVTQSDPLNIVSLLYTPNPSFTTATAAASPPVVAITYAKNVASQNLWMSACNDGSANQFAVALGHSTLSQDAGAAADAGFTFALSPQSGGSCYDGVAFDQANNMWLADWQNSRVVSYSFSSGSPSPTTYTVVATEGTNTGVTVQPGALAVGPHGDLWVADYTNKFIVQVPAGAMTDAGTILGAPNSIDTGAGTSGNRFSFGDLAFDPSGNLWASNDNRNGAPGTALVKYPSVGDAGVASTAQFSINWSNGCPGLSPPSSDGTNIHPLGISFDSAGRLWAVCQGSSIANSTVVAYTVVGATSAPSSPAVTLTGLPGYPNDLTFDAAGNLWLMTNPNSYAAGNGGASGTLTRINKAAIPSTTSPTSVATLPHATFTGLPPLDNGLVFDPPAPKMGLLPCTGANCPL